MKQVLLMVHKGIRCAMPADQAMDIGEDTEIDHHIDLWKGRPESTAASHAVRVSTPAGVRSLRCSDPRLIDMLDGTFGPLPGLVRDIMALPHVVGTAEIKGEIVWLVDVRRLTLDRISG